MNLKALAATLPLRALGAYMNTQALVSRKTAGAKALELFSKPRSYKSKTHHEGLIARADRGRIQVNGAAITYYRWKGSGKRVLLAHGWESNASRWAPLIRELEKQGYDIIAPDAPAHGYSEGRIFTVRLYADALHTLLTQQPADILIGHSAGGMAVAYLLHQYPEIRPEKLVLLAAPSELNRLMDTFRRMIYMNDVVFQALQDAFLQQYGWPMSDFSLQRFMRGISTPGLLIHDRDDPIAPFEEGLAIHQNWPESRMIATQGLGHSLPGNQVVEAILQYLSE